MINPKKLLVKNLIMMGMFIIFGICCIVMKKTDSTYIGFFSGGLIVTLLNILRVTKMMKNEDYKKQIEIDANDERTKMINSKTSEISAFIMVMGCCICNFICMFLEKNEYIIFFTGIILIYAVVFYVVKAILNKKY